MIRAGNSTIVGVFANHQNAHRAVMELKAAGFGQDQIGILCRSDEGDVEGGDAEGNDVEGHFGAAVGAADWGLGAWMATGPHGVPWPEVFVSANGDLTLDLPSNIDDLHIHEYLPFLVTREIAHFQQSSAGYSGIELTFPPGSTPGDLRFTHTYDNLSPGEEARGPWDAGQTWEYVEYPVAQLEDTCGQTDKPMERHQREQTALKLAGKAIGTSRSRQITRTTPPRRSWLVALWQWSTMNGGAGGPPRPPVTCAALSIRASARRLSVNVVVIEKSASTALDS